MKLMDPIVAAMDETLDKMAFMSFSAVADANVAASPFAYTVRIGFRGKLSGELTLYFTEKTSVAMSRNLLGLREGQALYPGTQEDALKEFANILMGRTLSLLDPATPFALEIPRALAGEDPAPAGAAGGEEIRGMFDDYEPCRLVIVYR
jgi:CheY-specific phosphatase CheX